MYNQIRRERKEIFFYLRVRKLKWLMILAITLNGKRFHVM